ncbi:hypothetical protein DESUT3_05600 [Desulfuromonas versatilis]|uniref:Uncharacterized protein n=1 Tax=Desulfuromonas versatilis TaxID=2802975 RepID=A0ABM8HSQ4_9BACT|nr:hypothetical protein DESUT3_05600 [Desulfuromonas versatilis]
MQGGYGQSLSHQGDNVTGRIGWMLSAKAGMDFQQQPDHPIGGSGLAQAQKTIQQATHQRLGLVAASETAGRTIGENAQCHSTGF